MSKMSSKTVNISLPASLLDAIDKAARSDYASRSDFIRETLVRRLKNQRIIDEWGDEGEWETVVNFQEISRGGVPAKAVLQALDDLTK